MCKTNGRIELHAHSDYSNIRLLDSVVQIEELILKSHELGLRGVALTDHEFVGSHVKMIQTARKLKEKGKIPEDFKIILGNEIYLVDSLEEVRDNYQSGITKFPHYLLLARSKEGHEALRILSSKAWENSFYTGTMERVPTIKETLEEVVKQFPNSLIASSACLGSESSIHILAAEQAKQDGDKHKYEYHNNKLHEFIQWNIDLHGKDSFFLELQPAQSTEQITVNNELVKLSEQYGLKMIITSDVHYLRPEDAPIHTAYLNAKEGDREIAEFYSDTYLHSSEEVFNKMNYLNEDIIKEAIENTLLIGSMVEDYTIEGETVIPVTKLPEFEVSHLFKGGYKKYNYINKMAHSDNEQDRYLIYLIENGFREKIPYKTMTKEQFHEVMARIDIELEELWEISKILNQSMASYYVTISKIIEIIWGDDCGDESRELGSITSPGRGSAVAFFLNFLLGITDVSPLNYGIYIPHFRHLHKSKADISALDIDIDLNAFKFSYVIERMKKFFGEKQVIQVSTFGKEKSKSAIQTACRGLGYDNDIGLYLSSMIGSERGDVWTLSDCLYGNEEKERKPNTQFINEIEKYPMLKETALKLENLVNKRSIHAGGLLILNEDYTKLNAMMRSPNKVFVTQYNLDDSQAMGAIKFDLLRTDSTSKIQETMESLLKHGEIEWQGTLRKTYNKYLHPEVIDKESPELFEMISQDKIIDLFQFSTQLGQAVIKKAKPKNLLELVSLNSIMRLMSDGGEDQPIDIFIKFKENIDLWYQEMIDFGLNEDEIKVFEKHLLPLNGVSDTQESVMIMAMDENIAGMDIKSVGYLRKSISKKNEELQKEVKKMLYEAGEKAGSRKVVIDYLWHQIERQLG